MSSEISKNLIRLFGMSTLQINSSLKEVEKDHQITITNSNRNVAEDLKDFNHFDLDIRRAAKRMARHYEVFFCLENSIRTIVKEILEKKFGEDWWEIAVDTQIKKDVADRMRRDLDTGFNMRSDDHLDFANFGELSMIIEKQWENFDDLFKSRTAMKKVFTSLNTLRGPIAHCCDLAEDEAKRLEITINDWFRLMD